jgi:hypothetical protein
MAGVACICSVPLSCLLKVLERLSDLDADRDLGGIIGDVAPENEGLWCEESTVLEGDPIAVEPFTLLLLDRAGIRGEAGAS